MTTEPARRNVKEFVNSDEVTTEESRVDEGRLEEASEVLNESEVNGDVWIVAGVLERDEVAVVSDDRRVRSIAEGLGATVTGTVGVVVRSVKQGVSEERGKQVIDRTDEHGLHMTAELRDKAYELIKSG